MGLTPVTYLIRLRLHRVRRALLASTQGSTHGVDRGTQLGLLALRRILARLQGLLRRAAVGHAATKARRAAAVSLAGRAAPTGRDLSSFGESPCAAHRRRRPVRSEVLALRQLTERFAADEQFRVVVSPARRSFDCPRVEPSTIRRLSPMNSRRLGAPPADASGRQRAERRRSTKIRAVVVRSSLNYLSRATGWSRPIGAQICPVWRAKTIKKPGRNSWLLFIAETTHGTCKRRPGIIVVTVRRSDLSAFLAAHGIAPACHAHPPVMTVAESERLVPPLPGAGPRTCSCGTARVSGTFS